MQVGKKKQVKLLPGILLCLTKIHNKKKTQSTHLNQTALPGELFDAALACPAQAGAEARGYLFNCPFKEATKAAPPHLQAQPS